MTTPPRLGSGMCKAGFLGDDAPRAASLADGHDKWHVYRWFFLVMLLLILVPLLSATTVAGAKLVFLTMTLASSLSIGQDSGKQYKDRWPAGRAPFSAPLCPQAVPRTRKPGSAGNGAPRTLVCSGMRPAGSHGGDVPCAAVSADTRPWRVCCRFLGGRTGFAFGQGCTFSHSRAGFHPEAAPWELEPSSTIDAVDLEARL